MSIVSRNSNQGPIQTMQPSESKRSLYSENSYDSNDVDKIKKSSIFMKRNIGNNNQQPISNKLSHPTKPILSNPRQIMPEYKGQKNGGKYVSPKQQENDDYRGLPKLLTQFNTIGLVGGKSNNKGSNRYQQNFGEPMRPQGVHGVQSFQSGNDFRSSFYAEKQRMLRSSQGGRWFRSQSLMQGNQVTSPHISNGVQLKSYYPSGSKYSQLLQKYLKYYYSTQKQLQNRWPKYKISLYSSLQEIKNKMEAYLEKKIDLSNIPIDRPDSDWNQQQLMQFYTQYQPILLQKIPTPHINDKKDKLGEQGNQKSVTVLKKYKNCVYYGPILNGKKHGFGYLHYFSGRFFEGLFLEDQKSQGFEMDDSELYLGQYKKNQRHGQGILKTNQFLLSGIFTEGEFKTHNKNNQENKQQLQIYDGFKIQFSAIKIYMRSPFLIEKNAAGDLFIGEATNYTQIKNGEGLQIFANGDIYIGKYEQGVPQGYGQYYWQSGAFYRGLFLTGMRHGKGVWMMVNGDKYEGQYMNDKKNGKGIYTWKAGDRYEGSFENDYRHGYGQMNWRDGHNYKGNWSNGIQINKVIKLQQEQKQPTNQPKLPRANIKAHSRLGKGSFKTIEPKRRNNITSTSFNTIHNKISSRDKNSKRVPLQKLKAMLNPTNNKN